MEYQSNWPPADIVVTLAHKNEDKLKTSTISEGWICPKCGMIYNPSILQCWQCNPKEIKEKSEEENDELVSDWY